MHLLTEKSIQIQRPAQAVFDYVTNMEKFADWFPGVLSIASSNALPHGKVGKTYRETMAVPFGGTRNIEIQVREVRGTQFFATEGKFPPLLPRMEIGLEETGADSCQLTWRMFSRNRSPIARFLLLPLSRRVIDRRAAQGVVALKKRLEADES